MNLKPELLATLIALGIDEQELALLQAGMLGTVSSLQSQIEALSGQIENLTNQRNALVAQLNQANITVGKLIDLTSQL